MYALICPAYSEEHRKWVIAALLSARPAALDVYSRGIRNVCPREEALPSMACRATLEGDFAHHAHNISQIERLSAELTRGHNPRALPRSCSSTADCSLLRQVKTAHKHEGGEDPLAPRALERQPLRETLLCPPSCL